MFSDTPMSPRPLAPARARRSVSHSRLRSSTDQRPPPPYATLPDKPTLLGSPIGVTTKLMRLAEEGPEVTQSWMQEKSKDELEELLQKAGNLIRDREEELDRTAAACKRLSTSNAILKTENDSLLSRIPSYERESVTLSPSPSLHTLVDAFSPSHTPSHSLQDPPVWTPSLPTKRHRRLYSHARRPSASPAELAALADQNADLLTKLQDLENDAARVEQAGKRRLKGLEKEIQGLKDELDRTRNASARLEETLQEQGRLSKGGKPVFEGMPEGLEEDLVKMWKRLRRDEKVREIRARTRPWETQTETSFEDPKDFAPAAPWVSPRRSPVRKQVSCSSLGSNFQSDADEVLDFNGQDGLPDVSLSSSEVPASRSFPTLGHSVREQALVSRLLAKVHELEETNAQLASEHQEANRRLLDAQTESEGVKRLCDFIKDEMSNVGEGIGALQLEMVAANADLDSDDSGDQEDVFGSVAQTNGKESPSKKKTVTLRSVRSKASLKLDLVPGSNLEDSLSVISNASSSDPFQPVKGRRASPVSEAGAQGVKLSRKYRKTVRGLFDGDMFTSTPSLSPESLATHDASPIRFLKAKGSFETEDASNSSDMVTSASDVRLPSLSAEIGDALNGDRFSLRSHRSFVHLRSTSLAELLNSVDADPASSLSLPGTNASTSNSVRHHFAGTSSKHRAQATFLDKTDQKGSVRLRTLARSKSSINLRSPSSSLWPIKDVPHPPKSATADSDAKSKYKLVALLFEFWLWLQFAVLLLVVVYSMARRGPKTFIKVNAGQTSKSS